jgi:hypothetical protein
MKKILSIIIVSFSVLSLSAQTEMDKKNMLKTYVAPGVHVIGGSFPGPGTFSYGLIYSRQLSERRSLYTGIEHTLRNNDSSEGFITVPVQIKHHFKNGVYLNHGLLLSLYNSRQYKMDGNYDIKRRGLVGYGFGIGYEHVLNNGVILSLNPFLGWNGLFVGNDYAYINAGISVGVGYKF